MVTWRASRLVVLLLACACGSTSSASPGTANAAPGGGGDQVEERVVYEKLPDGSTKKTTIRTTRRTVEAPPPPPRPADPYPVSEPLAKYNVDRVNAYRATKGLPPLLYDAKISAFARRGSEQLSHDHTPHAHFAARAKGAPGFGSRSAENQGDPGGVPALDPDPIRSGQKQIDEMLRLMFEEGPGGGHYDNMMNPRFRRIGIGLVQAGGKLYMTNDLSD